jgi:hypothetical protein
LCHTGTLKMIMKFPASMIFAMLVLFSCNAKQGTKITSSMLADVAPQLTSGDSLDYRETYLNTEITKSVQLINQGGLPAENISYTLESGPENMIISEASDSSCKKRLALGERCVLDIVYRPQIRELGNSNLRISYNNGVETKILAIPISYSSGVRPSLVLFSGNGAFGPRELGSTYDKTIELKNMGDFDLHLTHDLASLFTLIPFTVPALTSVSSDQCQGFLRANQSCSLTISMDTSLISGLIFRSHKINFSSLRHSGSLTLAFSGIATEIRGILERTSSNSPLSFGDAIVGDSHTISINLRNSGYANLEVLSIATSPVVFVNPGCMAVGKILAPGDTCSLSLRYQPGSLADLPGQIILTYDDGKNSVPQTMTLQLSGSNKEASLLGDISINNGDLTFNQESIFSVTFDNSLGQTPVTLVPAGTLLLPSSRWKILTGNCFFNWGGGMTIPAGGACAQNFSFKPSALDSPSYSVSIPISYSNLSSTLRSFTLTFNLNIHPRGILQVVAPVNPQNLGHKFEGENIQHQIQVQNMGLGNASIISTVHGTGVSASSVPSSLFCEPGLTLSPGASCFVNISLPSSPLGAYSRQISYTYDNGIDASTSSMLHQLQYNVSPPGMISSSGSVDLGELNTGVVSNFNSSYQNSSQFPVFIGNPACTGCSSLTFNVINPLAAGTFGEIPAGQSKIISFSLLQSVPPISETEVGEFLLVSSFYNNQTISSSIPARYEQVFNYLLIKKAQATLGLNSYYGSSDIFQSTNSIEIINYVSRPSRSVRLNLTSQAWALSDVRSVNPPGNQSVVTKLPSSDPSACPDSCPLGRCKVLQQNESCFQDFSVAPQNIDANKSSKSDDYLITPTVRTEFPDGTLPDDPGAILKGVTNLRVTTRRPGVLTTNSECKEVLPISASGVGMIGKALCQVSNTGASAVVINSLSTSTSFSLAGLTSCSSGQTLSAGQSCLVEINYLAQTTTSTSGNVTFNFTSSGVSSTLTIATMGSIISNN